MWNKRLFAVICVACALFYACEKYEGTISGKVVFVKIGVEFSQMERGVKRWLIE